MKLVTEMSPHLPIRLITTGFFHTFQENPLLGQFLVLQILQNGDDP